MKYVLPVVALALAAVPAHAELTKTHRRELAVPGSGAFAVENLSGSMTVQAGSGSAVAVTVTVHGDDPSLVDAIQLVQDRDKEGRPRLLVRYPLDRHTRFRAPNAKADDSESSWSWLASLFGGSGSTVTYDDRRVSVGSSGPLLWADVQVEIPADVNGVFKNHVGVIRSSGTRGTLRFDSASGNITLDGVGGKVVADTGSGDVKAHRIDGSFSCDTGSGDCDVDGFRGDRVDCDTGSGSVRVSGATARVVNADTGSGDVKVDAEGVEEIAADTGSGSVDLAISGGSLRKVTADTGSGDVHLRLDPNASFEVRADIGSGDIVNRYADATPIIHGREVKGYRRGDGRTLIDVDTGSGDLVLEAR